MCYYADSADMTYTYNGRRWTPLPWAAHLLPLKARAELTLALAPTLTLTLTLTRTRTRTRTLTRTLPNQARAEAGCGGGDFKFNSCVLNLYQPWVRVPNPAP